jgi:hypothetical protein
MDQKAIDTGCTPLAICCGALVKGTAPTSDQRAIVVEFKSHNPNVATMLLEYGAGANIRDAEGKTALDHAMSPSPRGH